MAFDYLIRHRERSVAICLSKDNRIGFFAGTDFLARCPIAIGDLRSHRVHGLETGTIKS